MERQKNATIHCFGYVVILFQSGISGLVLDISINPVTFTGFFRIINITTKFENMKHLFITLKIQDGEHEHTHRVLTTCEDHENILEAANNYAKDYWGDSDKEEDSEWYYFLGGTIALKVQNVELLSEYEYNLLNQIFYGNTRTGYFKIVQAGYEKGLQREEVEINCGENGKIMIHQDEDKLGFIIDVYGQNNEAGTMTIWEEDLIDADEE